MENDDLILEFKNALLKARNSREIIENLYYSANTETRKMFEGIAAELDETDIFEAWTSSSWCAGN